MNHGRNLIKCDMCDEIKPKGGFNLCSACLRKWKRQTRPIYYLRTCWGEIKRRSTQKVPNREYICFGQEFCTKEEFIERFLTDPKFLKLYKEWQESGFKRGLAPSIDRIDGNLGYCINNIHFITNIENAQKEFSFKTILKKDNIVLEFDSRTSAGKFLRLESSQICRKLKKYKKYKGWEILDGSEFTKE